MTRYGRLPVALVLLSCFIASMVTQAMEDSGMHHITKHYSNMTLNAEEIEKQYQLGLAYRKGEVPHFTKDAPPTLFKAYDYFRLVAESTHPIFAVKGMYNAGYVLDLLGNYLEAYHWLCRAKAQGFAPAAKAIELLITENKIHPAEINETEGVPLLKGIPEVQAHIFSFLSPYTMTLFETCSKQRHMAAQLYWDHFISQWQKTWQVDEVQSQKLEEQDLSLKRLALAYYRLDQGIFMEIFDQWSRDIQMVKRHVDTAIDVQSDNQLVLAENYLWHYALLALQAKTGFPRHLRILAQLYYHHGDNIDAVCAHFATQPLQTTVNDINFTPRLIIKILKYFLDKSSFSAYRVANLTSKFNNKFTEEFIKQEHAIKNSLMLPILNTLENDLKQFFDAEPTLSLQQSFLKIALLLDKAMNLQYFSSRLPMLEKLADETIYYYLGLHYLYSNNILSHGNLSIHYFQQAPHHAHALCTVAIVRVSTPDFIDSRLPIEPIPYQTAANLGHPMALNNLAALYKDSNAKSYSVLKNISLALKYFQCAAAQGHTSAHSNLAMMYDEGKEIPQDYAKAVYYWQRAAAQGSTIAYEKLALCYEHGWGVTQNEIEATACRILKKAQLEEEIALSTPYF